MPELPEVETLCRQLQQIVINTRIEKTCILDSKLTIPDCLEGQSIVFVNRRGKNLVLGLNNGKRLEIHLRMTGRLLWQQEGEKPPHSRFIMNLSSGRVIVVDPRRFATLSLVADKDQEDQLVVDALSPGCGEILREKGIKRMRPVKSFLMDQQIIGGIGNIYACEILYQAGLAPIRKTASLSPDDWMLVEKATAAILSKAIECRGTSISDWRDLFGHKGEYQNELRVYGREGKNCLRCGEIIKRVRFLGRGTWFCPNCQI
ncbi:MAG: Formamidopyrimidine-DNA glycosylase [Syntrophus sp. PtaB.Bin001]|nr:MAG: Formamidopyrimidine-DNA glycosylase [Syntrophus sp. PtaB.Bin001]